MPEVLGSPRRRTWVLAISAAAVLLVGVVSLAVWLLSPPDGSSDEEIASSSTLLLETADWGASLPEASAASVETTDNQDTLTKDVSVIRSWTTTSAGNGFELRQDVLTKADAEAAHRVFADEDPGPNFREDLGGADPLDTAGAAHADEARGYCVPAKGGGCFLIHYMMRYGTHVVELGLTRSGADPGSAETMLRQLDTIIAQRLT